MIHLSNSGKMLAKFNCIVYMNGNHMMNNAASPLMSSVSARKSSKPFGIKVLQ